MESNDNAISAFALAQSQLGAAIKNEDNKFFKNKYADLTAIQNAVFPVFHQNGFAILQIPGKDEHGDYLETAFIHVSGTRFCGRVYLEYKSGDMQSKGGAITYARRYGLSAISGVPVEDDDGNAATGRDKIKTTPPPPPPPVDAQKLHWHDVAALVPPSRKDTPVGRGIKLMKFIESADAEKLNGMQKNALALIDEVRDVEPDFARKIVTAWENKQIELGIK